MNTPKPDTEQPCEEKILSDMHSFLWPKVKNVAYQTNSFPFYGIYEAMMDFAKAYHEFYSKPSPQEDGIRFTLKEIIAYQDTYIEFLSEDISNNTGFLISHGIRTSPAVVQRGVQLRERIEKAKSALKEYNSNQPVK